MHTFKFRPLLGLCAALAIFLTCSDFFRSSVVLFNQNVARKSV